MPPSADRAGGAADSEPSLSAASPVDAGEEAAAGADAPVDADADAEAFADGDPDPDAEADADAPVEADGDAEADRDGDAEADAVVEADGAALSSGRLVTVEGRTGSRSASPLPSPLNSPPTNAAVPTTAATAAPTASAAKGLRRRGRTGSGAGAPGWLSGVRGPVSPGSGPGPAGSRNRGIVVAASPAWPSAGCPVAPPAGYPVEPPRPVAVSSAPAVSSPPSVTYGRMRSGSKSSVAANSAERPAWCSWTTRCCSAARCSCVMCGRPPSHGCPAPPRGAQPQPGPVPGLLSVPHSGQICPVIVGPLPLNCLRLCSPPPGSPIVRPLGRP